MGGMGGGAGGEPGAMGGAGGGQGQGDAGADPTDAGNPAADTWENFALPYMVKYCASCHNDDNQGDAQRNYRMFAAVMNESEEIACGSAKSQEVRDTLNCGGGAPRARQFPVGNGPRPTDEERDRLVQWLQAGLPE